MPRLPPAEKLPLVVRKNVRDDWDANKADLEKQLSDVLGTAWTIDIDPATVWPYHSDGYAKESLGSCLKAYVEGAIYQLKSFRDNEGDDGLAELNSICAAHVLALDLDEHEKFSYCGAEVRDGGRLVLLFREGSLGTNIDYAVERSVLNKALDEAPAPAGSASKLTYAARAGIRKEYDAQIEPTRAKIASLLRLDGLALEPRFEELCASLEPHGASLGPDWKSRLGNLARSYFEGAAFSLEHQGFGSDEMMREALAEEMGGAAVALRVVGELTRASYCEAVLEGGVLFVQAKPSWWGVNTSDACEGLADLL